MTPGKTVEKDTRDAVEWRLAPHVARNENMVYTNVKETLWFATMNNTMRLTKSTYHDSGRR